MPSPVFSPCPNGLRCRCKGAVLLVPLLGHQHHLLLPSTHLEAIVQGAPSSAGCGDSPQPPILFHAKAPTPRDPAQDTAQSSPEHHFQLVPDSLFQLHPGSLKSHQNLSLKCHMMKQLDWSCGGTSEGQLHSLHKKH